MAQSRSRKEIRANVRAPYVVGAGLSNTPSTDGQIDAGYVFRAANPTAGGPDIPLFGTSAAGDVISGGSFTTAVWQQIRFKAAANGNIVTTNFHVFNVSGRIMRIVERHTTAGNHASAVTAVITKEVDGQAAGAGTAVMSSTFNLKGTAETDQTATLSTDAGATTFAANDALSFKLTGTATTCAGVNVWVYVQYDLPVFEQSWYSAAVTSQDQAFFIANRLYGLRSVKFRHGVKETTDTTANVQVTQDTSTNAPGAGTDLLTNDTNAGFDINAAANYVQSGVLTGTIELAASDRLGIDFNSTQTEGAGICITACFNQDEALRIETTYWLYDTDVLDMFFMRAERPYEIYDGRFLHAVAAGGASTCNLEKSRSTTAVGGGTAMLASAIDLNATANTIQVTSLSSTTAVRQLATGDLVCVDFANTEQSLVGLCFTISWRAR